MPDFNIIYTAIQDPMPGGKYHHDHDDLGTGPRMPDSSVLAHGAHAGGAKSGGMKENICVGRGWNKAVSERAVEFCKCVGW